jgi:hypothetical protein
MNQIATETLLEKSDLSVFFVAITITNERRHSSFGNLFIPGAGHHYIRKVAMGNKMWARKQNPNFTIFFLHLTVIR